jgi:hypothetical protein
VSGAELQTFEVRPARISAEESAAALAVVRRRIRDEEAAAEVVAILGLDTPTVPEPVRPAVFVDHGTRGTYQRGCRCCVCEDRMVRLGLIGGES